MLARRNRLSTAEFETVFNQGSAIHGTFIFVKYLKKIDSKVGFAVATPKKIINKAWSRHQVRRQIYAQVRLWLQSQPDSITGFQAIIIIKKPFIETPSDVWVSELKRLLNSIK